jgi:uncharacterized protein YecE (DUF72 family)
MSAAKLRIGTSGWHYKHWRGLFYPEKLSFPEMFFWYARHFDTVEINNSFYQLPSPEVFTKWREDAPPAFTFAVKASRFITHWKKLKDPESAIQAFLASAECLGDKLGPILFQLPPHWHANPSRLEEFLQALPAKHPYVFEFRDESWNAPQIVDILGRYNAALCLHDWRNRDWPIEITADFTYIRLHGPGGSYDGNYSKQQLQAWADRIISWRNRLTNIFVYFNNDIGGHAVTNAQELKKMLKLTKSVKAPRAA